MEGIVLYGFSDNDRSGKVRWTARELGLEVEERRVPTGTHRKPPYRDLNPYGTIPTVLWRDHVLFESTAACSFLAEHHPESGLVVQPGEEGRWDYLHWMAVFGETLEAKLVEHLLSKAGILPPAFAELHGPFLGSRLKTVRARLPERGFLAAGRFTLADVLAAYSLRLAISGGLVERGAVAGYLDPLIARPAAVEARFFTSIEEAS